MTHADNPPPPECDTVAQLGALIRDVPDFPRPGIVFKDITPLLRDAGGLSRAVDAIVAPYLGKSIDVVGGAESRGFIFAMAVAAKLSAGFVPFRKPGRLPRETHRREYALEYGTNALEVHHDAVGPGDRVLLVDDLLATGGTMGACCSLVEALGGEIVGTSFLVELKFLGGRAKLGGYPIHSVLAYD